MSAATPATCLPRGLVHNEGFTLTAVPRAAYEPRIRRDIVCKQPPQRRRLTQAADEIVPLRGFTISSLLSGAECDFIIRESHAHMTPMDDAFPIEYRRSNRAMILSKAMASDIFHRLLPYFTEDEVGPGIAPLCFGHGGIWFPHSCNEAIKINRYDPGGMFTRHRDGPWIPCEDMASIYTVLIYLNDCFEGGATTFWKQRKDHWNRVRDDDVATVRPVRGTAVVFNHDAWHSGDVVAKGCKYVLRTEVIFHRPRGIFIAADRYLYQTDVAYQHAKKLYEASQRALQSGEREAFVVTYQDVVACQREAMIAFRDGVVSATAGSRFLRGVPVEAFYTFCAFATDRELVGLMRVNRATYYALNHAAVVWEVRYAKLRREMLTFTSDSAAAAKGPPSTTSRTTTTKKETLSDDPMQATWRPPLLRWHCREWRNMDLACGEPRPLSANARHGSAETGDGAPRPSSSCVSVDWFALFVRLRRWTSRHHPLSPVVLWMGSQMATVARSAAAPPSQILATEFGVGADYTPMKLPIAVFSDATRVNELLRDVLEDPEWSSRSELNIPNILGGGKTAVTDDQRHPLRKRRLFDGPADEDYCASVNEHCVMASHPSNGQVAYAALSEQGLAQLMIVNQLPNRASFFEDDPYHMNLMDTDRFFIDFEHPSRQSSRRFYMHIGREPSEKPATVPVVDAWHGTTVAQPISQEEADSHRAQEVMIGAAPIASSRVTVQWMHLGRLLSSVADLSLCPIVLAIPPWWYYYGGDSYDADAAGTRIWQESMQSFWPLWATRERFGPDDRRAATTAGDEHDEHDAPSQRRAQALLERSMRNLLHTTGASAMGSIDAAEAVALSAGVADAIVVQVATFVAPRVVVEHDVTEDHWAFRTVTYVSYVRDGRLTQPPSAYFGPLVLGAPGANSTGSPQNWWNYPKRHRLAVTMRPEHHVPLSTLIRQHPALAPRSSALSRTNVLDPASAWARNVPVLVVDASGIRHPTPSFVGSSAFAEDMLEAMGRTPRAPSDETDVVDFDGPAPVSLQPRVFALCGTPSTPCPPVYLELFNEYRPSTLSHSDETAGGAEGARLLLFDWFAVERGALMAAIAQPDFRDSLAFADETHAAPAPH